LGPHLGRFERILSGSAIPGFTEHRIAVNGQSIAVSRGGSGPPVLLLHGFPQTRAMWHQIAPHLAGTYSVVACDLRGYGASSKPDAVSAYSFRALAADQCAVMHSLGFQRFHVIGHDRGGRVAHRMALDRPEAVLSLTVMDIVPTHRLLSDLHRDVATAYYHWFFLAQPTPFPERLIGADPDYFFETCLLGWGGASLAQFDPDALAAYRTAWRDPDTIRGMCNDYRAAVQIDIVHDAADLERRVVCPALVLFGADGVMARSFDMPKTWTDRLSDMRHEALPGGHFFPDTHASETCAALTTFLAKPG